MIDAAARDHVVDNCPGKKPSGASSPSLRARAFSTSTIPYSDHNIRQTFRATCVRGWSRVSCRERNIRCRGGRPAAITGAASSRGYFRFPILPIDRSGRLHVGVARPQVPRWHSRGMIGGNSSRRRHRLLSLSHCPQIGRPQSTVAKGQDADKKRHRNSGRTAGSDVFIRLPPSA